ncbi:MAG: hypothetical protein HQL39_20325 [Alphaproteobacteria bacterium]|nr:hypothetical protein [Alphaproteobacteria bacterium]
MEARMARRWRETSRWLARRLLTRAVLAGLAPGLAAIVIVHLVLGLYGLG